MVRVALIFMALLHVCSVGADSSTVNDDTVHVIANASVSPTNLVEYELHLDETPKKSKVVLA